MYFLSYIFLLQSFQVRFFPEIVAIGPDPKTGLLTSNFTLYYGVHNLPSGEAGNLMINDADGTQGIVSIKDPIHTLQVKK